MDDSGRDALNQVAMQIILHAGDARALLRTTYESLAAQDFVKAQEVLAAAKADITKAHKAQTELIQAEARGERHAPTLLFNHAQDTLMTINSEWVTASNLLGVVQAFSTRIDEVVARLDRAEAEHDE
jgi:cellobiose-specific phosphotransferase system component IIA